MEKQWRRSMPLLSMNIVMQLTGLTARQIRYYEENELIFPSRTEGKQRMFSLDDIDTLLEIKDLLQSGVNIAGIKQIFEMKKQPTGTSTNAISDAELRSIVKEELKKSQLNQRVSLRQGDLSRFFNQGRY
ncbi:MerR family transcriptional regulator [Chryseomicrobium palamuruense]|uniref:MerR family transcriptional regulator n=1 Tax=Chryseomicrobium palamuruense TaxID=682973 RepID=A0ABV8UUM1_9BACL